MLELARGPGDFFATLLLLRDQERLEATCELELDRDGTVVNTVHWASAYLGLGRPGFERLSAPAAPAGTG